MTLQFQGLEDLLEELELLQELPLHPAVLEVLCGCSELGALGHQEKRVIRLSIGWQPIL